MEQINRPCYGRMKSLIAGAVEVKSICCVIIQRLIIIISGPVCQIPLLPPPDLCGHCVEELDCPVD